MGLCRGKLGLAGRGLAAISIGWIGWCFGSTIGIAAFGTAISAAWPFAILRIVGVWLVCRYW
jgi:hypothetical protein